MDQKACADPDRKPTHHGLGYTPYNASAQIKVRSDTTRRGAALAKRIISEVEVGLLIRATRSKRDRVLLERLYAAGLRWLRGPATNLICS